MTFTGTITSIQMSGLQAREPNNISLRMGLQSPIQVLENAATDNIRENMSSILGPLIQGTVPSIGTHYNKVVVDMQSLSEQHAALEAQIEDIL
jgi:hypothetical protein